MRNLLKMERLNEGNAVISNCKGGFKSLRAASRWPP